MQKIVLCGTEKITLLEQIITDYDDKIESLERKIEEYNTKINDMDLKMQDFNIADLLKANTGGADGGDGEGNNNNLTLTLISNLEKKFNTKSKTTDDRLNKIEETNFRLSKDTQNLKNVQDGQKRSINNLKQANEDIITNMKILEHKIVEIAPDMAKKLESQMKFIQKEREEKEEKEESSNSEEKERKNSILSASKPEPQIDLENNEKIKEIMKRIVDLEKSVKLLPNQIGTEQIKSDISALKSGIGNCALSQDLKEARENYKESFDTYKKYTSKHAKKYSLTEFKKM